MERSKWRELLAPIVSDFLRVGMWPIGIPASRTVDPDTGIVKSIYKYGTGDKAGAIVVHGELSEKDRGTFLIISSMDSNSGFKGITGEISDLVKRKGVKNPYQKRATDPMWDSVESLLNVHVRIKPNKRGAGLSAAFKLVSGWIDSDGSFFLTTSDYHQMIESLGLYEYNVKLSNYFKYKSAFTRSLKVFIETQDPFYQDKGYHISLKKLCKHIGYNPPNIPWPRVWQNINDAMEELIEEGFLSKKSGRDKTRSKTDGGIVSFWYARQEVEG